MTIIRLLLGDQLNPGHSWFAVTQPDVVYVMMEVRQETDYVLHHAQKVLAIFAAMRNFAHHLQTAGHRVCYLAIDDAANRHAIADNLDRLILDLGASAFEYQAPDEWRLDRLLADYAGGLRIPARMADSEHFITHRRDAGKFFASRSRWMMEPYYRHLRTLHEVLVEPNGRPVGGRWNFDAENRKAWRGVPEEPEDSRPRHDHRTLWERIVASGVRTFGQPHAEDFRWPINRAEALLQLESFMRHGLPWFGDYQDAMSTRAAQLFHSRLSFALNVKMLSPQEVIAHAVACWRAGTAPLPAVEGFVRQILGWREYVRGVYWEYMPEYAEVNFFDHRRRLPEWFWTGSTRMNCLHHAIGQSLEHAHAHHIQRLMLIGNFALLAGIDPQEVHRWYLGIYIDAFEWVELPNTLGMSQFADGGLLATKPYVSAAAYIRRMSDYCGRCHYRPAERAGERACPFNSFYWDFLTRERGRLAENPRLAMAYQQLDRLAPDQIGLLRARASDLRARLDQL